MKEYVGTSELILLYNEDKFNPLLYEEESITHHSKLVELQFSSEKPVYTYMRAEHNIIDDETTFF